MNISNLKPYKRAIYAGIIAIVLGVVFRTSLGETSGSLGTVFIALGGLLFIIGMSRKKEEDKHLNN